MTVRPRYVATKVLRDGPERHVDLGRDTWTGHQVILKTAHVDSVCREARCLLSVTGEATPELLDLQGGGSGRATLVLKHIPGRSLDSISRRAQSKLLPRFARDACVCLAHIHRSGWIHADLSPRNILILEGAGESVCVRLIDLGFAQPLFGGADAGLERGGTIGYMAPELARGWAIDARTDLYSLGAVIRECLGPYKAARPWTAVLERFLEEAPSRRYASAVEARIAIEGAFGLTPSTGHRPRFGSGSIRGREEILSHLVDHLRDPSTRILIQARPGIGSTRLLLETAVRVLASGGQAPELIDLSSLDAGPGTQAALHRLEALVDDAKAGVVCVVADPSPGLHWLAHPSADRLRTVVLGEGWERIVVPRVRRGSFREIAAASAGSLDPTIERHADALYDRTEGDLRLSAQAFEAAIAVSGEEQGLGWTFRQLVPPFDPPQPWADLLPHYSAIPAALIEPVRLCARAGPTLRRPLAEALLARFAPGLALDALLDAGYLVPESTERLAFITRCLWREATCASMPGDGEVDSWLRDHLTPDPDNIDEVLGACGIAHRLGDHRWESTWLAPAIKRASDHRRWDAVLRILCHHHAPPPVWTMDAVEARIATLRQCLPSDWTSHRLHAMTGIAIRSVDPATGRQILELAAASPEAETAGQALLFLADRVVDDPNDAGFDLYAEKLYAHLGRVGQLQSGLIEYLTARRALAQGRLPEAARSAGDAVRLLHGSGRVEESLSVQILAAARFDTSPEEAIALLDEHLSQTTDPELTVQLRYNLARMLGELGRHEAALAPAEAGLAASGSSVSPARALLLRTQRAWLRLNLGRIVEAMEEARALLQASRIRFMPMRRIPLRLLLGQCLVIQGHGSAGLRELAAAVEDAAQHAPPSLRWESVGLLLDAILDLDAWDFVREHIAELAPGLCGTSPLERAMQARARAIIAHGAGRLVDARSILDEHLPALGQMGNTLLAARYHFHAGCVCLEQAAEGSDRTAARAALKHFMAGLGMLPDAGLEYHRARTLLKFAQAYAAALQRRDALTTLTKAVALARLLDARGLLADCLDARAEIEMSGVDR